MNLTEARDSIIKRQAELTAYVKGNSDLLCLNLGAGGFWPGWTNSDLYPSNPKVMKHSLHEIPYADGSVDIIRCDHAIEHAPFRHARMAFMEWARVLKPKGFLWLTLPDGQACCEKLLSAQTLPEVEWAIYTLFGWQRSQEDQTDNLNSPIAPGEFHFCAFTDKMICAYLDASGFDIHECLKYDGYGTPGIFVRGHKRG